MTRAFEWVECADVRLALDMARLMIDPENQPPQYEPEEALRSIGKGLASLEGVSQRAQQLSDLLVTRDFDEARSIAVEVRMVER